MFNNHCEFMVRKTHVLINMPRDKSKIRLSMTQPEDWRSVKINETSSPSCIWPVFKTFNCTFPSELTALIQSGRRDSYRSHSSSTVDIYLWLHHRREGRMYTKRSFCSLNRMWHHIQHQSSQESKSEEDPTRGCTVFLKVLAALQVYK